ncbi:hypothetical protein MSPP1_003203 [Malassezia sp. CBS 17886]|nr:hypothetical protein MSPP1_003203 [Malassezia sp. CBS 17886]
MLRRVLPSPGRHVRMPSASGSANSSARTAPHLTLFTGTHCQLCDEAKAVLNEVGTTVPFTLSTYNIRDDSEPDVQYWRRKYQFDIPVLHLHVAGASERDTAPGGESRVLDDGTDSAREAAYGHGTRGVAMH